MGFEPTIPVNERPQTHALDRAATGIGYIPSKFLCFIHLHVLRVNFISKLWTLHAFYLTIVVGCFTPASLSYKIRLEVVNVLIRLRGVSAGRT
jgi:hypothetical protein